MKTAKRTSITVFALVIGIVCSSPHAAIDDGPEAQATPSRPKICLALSGGGARGAAHVGVLKALEQLHIPIDCIAGTSMGAVVGGLYASGMSVDEIEREMVQMDWDNALQDAQPRPDRNFRRKQDDRANFSKGKPGVKDGKITVQPAFVLGQKFDLELNRLTLPVAEITNFDKFRIPFRAVATDLATGKAVVLSHGNLARAMHASMAVPSAFAGVEIDDQLLVDGGVANNLPIDVARAMGADIVIAVDISTPLYKREQLGSPLVVVDQLTNILTRRSADAQIATLTERDILIAPDMKDITSADFSRAKEAADLGQASTEAARDKLSRLSLSPALFAEHEHMHTIVRSGAPTLDFVKVDNNSQLDDELILQRLGIKPGEQMDLEKLQAGIGTVYGLGVFESVRYEIVEEYGKTGLLIHAQEKSWGTNFLQFGAELATDLNGGSSAFNLGVVYTAIPMNSLNGEWRTGVQIGEEPAIFTEWYQPLDPLSRYFINALVSDQRQRFKVFSGDTVTAEYLLKTATAGVAVGRELGTWGEVRLGYQRYHGEAEVVVGPPVLGEPNFDGGEANLRLSADTLDNVRFPQQGYAGALQWTASRHSFGADNNFDQVSLNVAKAQSWHSNTLFGRLLLNTTLDDDAPLQNQFRLGGFTQFSGLLPNQLNGQHAGLLTVGYMRRLYNVKILTVYAGSTIELGNVWQKKSDISFNDTLTAGSVFLGVDLPIGPLYIGYGVTEGNRDTLFLLLGQPWF